MDEAVKQEVDFKLQQIKDCLWKIGCNMSRLTELNREHKLNLNLDEYKVTGDKNGA